MKLATHDSLTAYPVKYGWLKPFNFLCRCQKKTLTEQHAAGAISFDLRFAKFRGEWYAAHGAMIYDLKADDALRILAGIAAAGSPVYFRVLCEDTFYRQSDGEELAALIDSKLSICKNRGIELICLYIRSKRTFRMIREYAANERCADYPAVWDKRYTPAGMANAVALMYSTETSDNKMNFVACYSSKFIPRFTAKILTRIALQKKWKENDIPVIDFI
jgi:hypothetical protein